MPPPPPCVLVLLADLELSHDEVEISTTAALSTAASFVVATKQELQENPEHNLKSTSLIMRTLRSATQFDEAMKELEKDPLPQWTGRSPVNRADPFTRSSQLMESMNAITKSSSGSSSSTSCWLMARQSPSPTRRYSSSVDGEASLREGSQIGTDRSRLRRFSHENAFLDAVPLVQKQPQTTTNSYENQLKHVNHLNILLEETKRLSDQVDGQLTMKLTSSSNGSMEGSSLTKKPVAAPRMKKLGSSSVMSQLTQLRRMYEAADEPESDTSTKADQEVCSFLGDRDNELFSGSWSKVKAKRNSAILSDMRTDHDLYLGSQPLDDPPPD